MVWFWFISDGQEVVQPNICSTQRQRSTTLAQAQEQHSWWLINVRGKSKGAGDVTVIMSADSFSIVQWGLAQFSSNAVIWHHEILLVWTHPTVVCKGRSMPESGNAHNFICEERRGKNKDFMHVNPEGYTAGFTCTELFPTHTHSKPCQTGFMVISVCQCPELARDDSGLVYQPATQWSKG